MGPTRVPARPHEAGGEPARRREEERQAVAGYCEDRNADEAVIPNGHQRGSPERPTCAGFRCAEQGLCRQTQAALKVSRSVTET